MKSLLSFLLISVFLAGCKKEKFTSSWEVGKVCTVEGYLYSSKKKPVANAVIALAQSETFSLDEPKATTDSTGYFRISYYPDEYKGYIHLHSALANYDCVTGDIYILKNLIKGEDLNVGKLYNFNY